MLERSIRPFQTPLVSNSRKIVVGTIESGQSATIEWGVTGKLPTPVSGAIGTQFCTELYQETSRQTKNVRVENPDDASQYVTEKRMTSVKFDKADQSHVLHSDLTAGIEQDFSQSFNELDASFRPADNGTSGKCQVQMTFQEPVTPGAG